MNKIIKIKYISFVIFISSLNFVFASPWAAVGDISLRNDVELLAHYGIISGPVNTWPMSWKQITRNFYKADSMELPIFIKRALVRVREKTPTEFNIGLRAQVTNNSTIVRGFENKARNDFDTSASIEYNGDSGTTIHIDGGYRAGDGENYSHLDGSYVSQDIDNWAIYAGAFDRWWGPGRESTLILSNNARPMPSIGLRRIEAKPFESNWLNWIGPWQWDMFVAKMERDRHIPNALIAGMRLSFTPINNFDVGLSRTMQLCGAGRPCGFKSWTKALVSIGDLDNPDTLNGINEEPGNQLASIDLSYSFKLANNKVLKLYAEGTAEDQNVILPFQFARLLGASILSSNDNYWSVTAEFSDTVSTHYWIGGQRKPNVIYKHHIYKTGYHYKNRSLGHTLDSSSRLVSLSFEYLTNNNTHYSMKFHNAVVNSSSAGVNTLSKTKKIINLLELSSMFDSKIGKIKLLTRLYDDHPNIRLQEKVGLDATISWELQY